MNKTKIAVVILALVFLASAAYTIHAVIVATSNSVIVTPQDDNIILSVDNETPRVGDTVTFTATLNTAETGVELDFYGNGTLLGTATTTSGTATFPYQILDNNTIEVIAVWET